jgi:MFS superfamily sulfate permease-like transporter
MPPEAGLYAFIAGAIGFAIIGTNRFLSAGADSTIAPIFASGLALLAVAGTPDYAALASLLAVMVGIVLIAAASLRAGWIADLLSMPVTIGFLAGIGVHVIIGQLPSVLGVPDIAGPLLARLPMLLHSAANTNLFALAIGVLVLMAAQLSERLAPHVPGALLAVAAAACATAWFGLSARGVDVLGALRFTMPHPGLPLGRPSDIPRLLPLALIVALVCMMQTAAVLRSFPSHQDGPRHVARDFGGIGAGNILAGLVGSFAINASPPRTAVVVSAGGRTKLAGLVAVGLTVALLLNGGAVLRFVPHAALGGLLVAIGVRLFRLREMQRIWRQGGNEFLLVAASALLVIVLPIDTGMLCSIVLSLLQSFYTVARPLCTELVRAPGTTVWWPVQTGQSGEHVPGVLVFAPAAPLHFTNAGFIRRRLLLQVQQASPMLHLVIIEASGMLDIDYTGSMALQQTIDRLRGHGIDVALARLSAERAQAKAKRTGLLDALGADHVFLSVEDAVRSLGRGTVSSA